MRRIHHPRNRLLRALALAIGLAAIASAQAQPELGQPAPALRGHFLSGEEFDLANMRGRVVLVNFFSSYCKYCAYEIGNLETFYEQHKAQGFEVIVLAIDDAADRDRVARMLNNYALPGTLISDLASNGFGLRYATPTAFIFDRAGILRHRMWGAKSPAHYREWVEPLLAD
jgi:cytochrome c biogenesis protein CcmG, thiol:disulfide interchange protein DsbE